MAKFPEDKWVCEIETNRKPWLKSTDHWPSQYLCLVRDRVYFIVYRVFDQNMQAVFRDKLDSLELKLKAEQDKSKSLKQQLEIDRKSNDKFKAAL